MRMIAHWRTVCWPLLSCILGALPLPQAQAASELVFAQVADGGGYRSTFLLTNPTALPTKARITLRNSEGAPMVIPSANGPASEFTVDLPAYGVARFETPGSQQSTQSGWARIVSEPATEIRGNCVFQLFGAGGLICEATVPAAIPSAVMDFFADEEGGFNTGFALANGGPSRAVGAIILRKADGSEAGRRGLVLEPGQHTAAFLAQLFPGALTGRAEIRLTEGTAAATAIRYRLWSTFSTVSIGQETPAADALFSPAGGVRARIIREIDRAQSSIDVAIYSFTSNEIRDALIAARGRGVAIRIAADTSQATTSGGEIPTLEQLGFSVRRMTGLGTGIMHNKYMIVDGRLVVTGSYNWSVSAENSNFENAVFLEQAPLVQKFISDFRSLWAR